MPWPVPMVALEDGFERLTEKVSLPSTFVSPKASTEICAGASCVTVKLPLVAE